jgi:(1->4)-alpha-D-glucan 1-alpha-D-glucosylmutase
LNPEVGTSEEFDAWVEAMRRRGMSHILDMVPNHVGVGTNDNIWWNDVLEHGPASKYAGYFDIAWRGSPRPELHDKVLLPVLGGPYGDVLERGELKVVHEDGKFRVGYHDRRFPLSPASTQGLDPSQLDGLNGRPGDPRSFDRLDRLLDAQHYRLAYWRSASDEINYRRFFDINDLAALAMEREDVFEATHAFTFELIERGVVAGLRIDHPDGLFDPEQYLRRLQAKRPGLYLVVEKILAPGEPLPADWPVHGTSGYDFLNMANGLFVDGRHERAFTRLYQEWTGDPAEFADLVYHKQKLILDTSLASELQMLAHRLDRLAQSDRHSRDFTHRGLRDALREVIACFPVYRSYVTARGVHESDRAHVNAAVERAIARNPGTEPAIYRFVGDAVLQRFAADDEGRHRDEWLAFAGRFQQLTAPVTAKGIEDTAFYIYNRFGSLNEVGGEPAHFWVGPDKLHAYLADRQAKWPYAMSTLSTHDTKRSEDMRARMNVLSGIPDQWREHVTRWGEVNARFRLEVNGLPAPSRNDEYMLYQTLVGVWPIDQASADETFVQRIQQYLTKAMREAKTFSGWTSPNEAHESAVTGFAASVIAHRPFLDDFLPFQGRISHWGMLNSLSQTLLKIAAPGVPDTYQGMAAWDFSLVDPDNRRPVDYELRRRMLEELKGRVDAVGHDRVELARELVAAKEDGRVKLYVTWQGLTCRRELPGLFSAGEYTPVEVTGAGREHVFAFVRRHGGRTAVVAVPRLVAGLTPAQGAQPVGPDVWQDTRLLLPAELSSARFRNRFTGETIAPAADAGLSALRAADVFTSFPVALLIAE